MSSYYNNITTSFDLSTSNCRTAKNSTSMSSDSDSDSFADFSSFESGDDTLELPSFGCIFQTNDMLIKYAQEWGIEAGYPLIILRSTRDKTGKKDRVYLRCDRGGKPKPNQEVTRLIDCKFQLAGHRKDEGWILSVDQSKGKFIILLY
jgi:hypothetical protein